MLATKKKQRGTKLISRDSLLAVLQETCEACAASQLPRTEGGLGGNQVRNLREASPARGKIYASCTPLRTPFSAPRRVSPSNNDPLSVSEYHVSLVSLRQPLEINPNLNPSTGVATRPLLLARAERESSFHQQSEVNYLPCFQDDDLPFRLHEKHAVCKVHRSRNRVNSSHQVAGGC